MVTSSALVGVVVQEVADGAQHAEAEGGLSLLGLAVRVEGSDLVGVQLPPQSGSGLALQL